MHGVRVVYMYEEGVHNVQILPHAIVHSCPLVVQYIVILHIE